MTAANGSVMPQWMPHWNKAVNNRLFKHLAPYVPPYALVVHVGRKSAVEYRTPVLAFRSGAHIAVALPYGDRCDWVRNLLAAGEGTLLRHGGRLQIRKLVVTDGRSPAVQQLPTKLRLAARTPRVLLAEIA